jgi:hypothetical protein
MARTDFTVTLRPQPNVDAVKALRAALKVLLRRYDLRAIRIEEREAQSRGLKNNPLLRPSA